jgi:hypothetical protein
MSLSKFKLSFSNKDLLERFYDEEKMAKLKKFTLVFFIGFFIMSITSVTMLLLTSGREDFTRDLIIFYYVPILFFTIIL